MTSVSMGPIPYPGPHRSRKRMNPWVWFRMRLGRCPYCTLHYTSRSALFGHLEWAHASKRHDWLMLGCNYCGHWTKGAVSKADVATWFRRHPEPVIRSSHEGLTCESVCPHPCEEQDPR